MNFIREDLEEWNYKWDYNLRHCAHKSIKKFIHLTTQSKSYWNSIFCASTSNVTRYHILHQLISCKNYYDKICLTLLILWMQINYCKQCHVNMCTSVSHSDKILTYYRTLDTFIRIGINCFGNVRRRKF